MKTTIMQSDINWKLVKNISRTTVNKKHTAVEASPVFKLAMLISEHSPIREIKIRWQWGSIKSWVATHFARHRWESYISTRRTDRTGQNRDELLQSELVKMDCSANAQSLIDTSRKRLCYQASPETRKYWEDLKLSLYDIGQEELFIALVPNCVYRAGCPEFSQCGHYKRLCDRDSHVASTSIQVRYKAYAALFLEDMDAQD